MNTAAVDIAFIHDAFQEQAEQLIEQWRCQQATEKTEKNPAHLSQAMSDLCRALQRFEPDGAEAPDAEPGAEREVEALGNYGLELLVELSEIAAETGLEDCSQEIEGLCLPMAAWVARRGGEIRRLPPIINTLARYANETTDPVRMRELYTLASEIFEAVSPNVIDADSNDPQHPWRLLVINRAIVATRTLEPALMEPALKAVVEFLPEDAPRFFEEGMQQMDAIGYPERVKEVMRRYHALFDSNRILH